MSKTKRKPHILVSFWENKIQQRRPSIIKPQKGALGFSYKQNLKTLKQTVIFSCQYIEAHCLNQKFIIDSAVVIEHQRVLKRDLLWLSSEQFFLHKWLQITCVGCEADCILVNLCKRLLCVFLTYNMIILDQQHLYSFTWFYTLLNPLDCASISLIEMSALDMMNEWCCFLELNYVHPNKSINNNRTTCPGL